MSKQMCGPRGHKPPFQFCIDMDTEVGLGGSNPGGLPEGERPTRSEGLNFRTCFPVIPV